MAMNYLGDFTTSNTVYVYFNTFDSNDPSASVTLTGLAVTDIEIYKDGSTTQRSSDAGYTLLDTDGIDFDTITGIHGFSIDLSDNTDAGFYAAGSEYVVVVSSVTVDAATVNFIAASFSIERSGGVLALAKGATGFAAIDTVVDAVLVDTEAAAPVLTDTEALLVDTEALDTATILTDTEAILLDTGTTLDTNISAILTDTEAAITERTTLLTDTEAILVDTEAAAPVLTDTEAILADSEAVLTDAEAILVDTGTTIPALLPAALVGGKMDANVGAISASTTAADNLEASALGVVSTTVNDASASTTAFVTALTEATDDHYNGRIIVFIDGALAGQATDITDYTGATKTVTCTALTEAPGNGDAFVIV